MLEIGSQPWEGRELDQLFYGTMDPAFKALDFLFVWVITISIFRLMIVRPKQLKIY